LGAPPLWRVAVVTQGQATHLAIAAHHAILDGWSLHRLMSTIWRLYQDPTAILPPEPSRTSSIELDRNKAKSFLAKLNLEWPNIPGLTGALPFGPRRAHIKKISDTDAQTLLISARHRGESFFTSATSAVARAVAGWSNLDSVILQIAHARRGVDILPDAIGSFSDTVPIQLLSNSSAQDVRTAWSEAGKVGYPGLVDLSSMLEAAPDKGPKVASPFSISVADFKLDTTSKLDVSDLVARTATHATRIGITIWSAGEGIGISLNFPQGWISETEVERLGDLIISEMLNEAKYKHFVDTIVEQCARVPHRPAIVMGETIISYKEMERASACLAAGLFVRGIGPGSLVVIVFRFFQGLLWYRKARCKSHN